MEAIAKLYKFKHFGLPILVGASRKRFINSVIATQPMERVAARSPPTDGLHECATIIRTHDVAETIQRSRVAAALSEYQMTGQRSDQVFVSGLALHAYHG